MGDDDLNNSFKKVKKKGGTFLPPSQVRASDIINPGKGKMISITVAWQDRVISSHYFEMGQAIFIGYDPKNDIVLPIGKKTHCLTKGKSSEQIILDSSMSSGELVKSDGVREAIGDLIRSGVAKKGGDDILLSLYQSEMLVVQCGDLTLYITYAKKQGKPFLAPLFDLSTSGLTGVLLALAVSAIFWLYMLIYVSDSLDGSEERLEETIRIARVTFKKPVKKIRITDKRAQVKGNKTKVKGTKKTEAKVQRTRTGPKRPSKSSEVKPNKTKTTKKSYTSTNKGRAVKTGPKKGANIKTKVDPTKVGLLSVFGSGSRRNFNKASQGTGELVGVADEATGSAGFNEDRAGDSFGTKNFEQGAGGKGAATVGIRGVGTKGKRSGNYGATTGGLGAKGSVNIDIGGDDEDITGFIDKEAIRRVILRNKRAIRYCYEVELNRNKGLYGRIVLSWDIVSRGSVRRARVKSNSLGSSRPARSVANCILRRLRAWKFPAPPDNVIGEVTYPFTFTSR